MTSRLPAPNFEGGALRAALSAIAAALLLLGGFAFAAQPRCPSPSVSVVGGTAADRAQACAGALDAIEFLARHGLVLRGTVVVRVVPALPEADPERSVAVFEPAQDEIRIRDYDSAARAALERPLALWPHMSPALWRSYVAHEVAHRIAEANMAAEVPRFTAIEYIGCVTQIATLPGNLRDAMLAAYSAQSAFEHEGQINAILYLIDPSAFTIRAYRHFAALRDGARFLEVLLENGAPSDYE